MVEQHMYSINVAPNGATAHVVESSQHYYDELSKYLSSYLAKGSVLAIPVRTLFGFTSST